MSLTYTLDSLFKAFPGGIIVPRIQRGYVQGRDNDKGKEICANFVPALVNAAFGGKELALDFIYGVAKDNGAGMRCLLPLDGQQRLTTLFLLAWLCGKWKLGWRFVYESRRIPQLFAQGLIEHTHEADCKPSVEIENSDWFLPVWMENPTVAGMVRMLDALHEAIGNLDRTEVDFGRISFLLHGIDGMGETFDHIFRKMNARGKELSPWENLKAMLDKHLPESLAKVWRDKIDGHWAETIWKHAGGDIGNLDNAMEKIARMAYARFAGTKAQGDSLWEMEARLCCNANDEDAKSFFPETLRAFYLTAMRYFDNLDSTAVRWTHDRTTNDLWSGSSDGADFWAWLADGSNASVADQLRIAFLTEPTTQSDAERHRRVLLNLLDASTGIKGENFQQALSAGLDFLAGQLDVSGIQERKAGYHTGQLEDEKRKWIIPDEVAIVGFEKDELVYEGRLQFIGWEPFVNVDDIGKRLSTIREAIHTDWLGFYTALASRLGKIPWGAYLHVPLNAHDITTWREFVFTNTLFLAAIQSWQREPDAKVVVPFWMRHLSELIKGERVRASTLRMLDDGWLFLLQNPSRRSAESIRLDWNEKERENRNLLKLGEIRYANPWPYAEAKEEGIKYNVCDESWWKTTSPKKEPLTP